MKARLSTQPLTGGMGSGSGYTLEPIRIMITPIQKLYTMNTEQATNHLHDSEAPKRLRAAGYTRIECECCEGTGRWKEQKGLPNGPCGICEGTGQQWRVPDVQITVNQQVDSQP